MKRYLSLLFFPFLIGCKEQIPLDYDSFQERMIEYQDLFEQDFDNYYVYIYSNHCGHCEDFKEEILQVFKNNENMYLIKYSNKIETSSRIDDTIGSTSIENVHILGTPTLMEIYKGVLVTNVAGKTDIRKIVSSL